MKQDVFELRQSIVDDYRRFATSFTTIQAPDIRQQVEAIYAEGRFWPEPLIQINPAYEPALSVAEAVAEGRLHPACEAIFPLRLHRHQQVAISLAAEGESFVVTTGTGSGKSLCFFIPIVHAVLTEKAQGGGGRVRAIVVYPMNALANSQYEELEKYLAHAPAGQEVTFARYTGQETAEEKQRVADHPPDILLTNFMMLELLMTRQDPRDRQVMAHCEGLRFLVLDELHTYRGRQGADVALLVRRVRERLSPKVQCIGTSATMKSDGSAEERDRVVANVASRLFAAPVAPTNVINETLVRVTAAESTVETVQNALGPAIDVGIAEDLSDAVLRVHPLAIWVELRLGITRTEEVLRWHRAPPLTLHEAAQRLSAEANRPIEPCKEALRRLLLISSRPEKDRVPGSTSERSFFPFKLHQFLSGAGHAYATLEPPGMRTVTVDDQVFLPDCEVEKRLFSTHFCRECGQAWHPVFLGLEEGVEVVRRRDIDDAPPASEDDDDDHDGEIGFVTVAGADADLDFADLEGEYPESWREPSGEKLKREYRRYRARSMRVCPDGRVLPDDALEGTPAWYLPGRFRFCIRCGQVHSGASRDRNRLASLSAEGRSSATTVLVSSTLRAMHRVPDGFPPAHKLLGFTDNRQDAALQAGHFNDFLFVSLVRAGFLAALRAAPDGLRADQLGAAHQRALGFDRADQALRAEWMLNPGGKGNDRLEAERVLRDVLKYRLWFDQRRGWRYTNPNLEQLGLLEVHYPALDELVNDESLFAEAPPVLRDATPTIRTRVFRTLLDHLRTGLAVQSDVLDAIQAEQLFQRAQQRLRLPWGFSTDERPRPGRWLMLKAPGRRHTRRGDEDLLVRGGARSVLGKQLRRASLWNSAAIRTLKEADFEALLGHLLKAAQDYGLVVEETTPFDVDGWRLKESAVSFHAASGGSSKENPYFRDLYDTLANQLGHRDHPLFGFEAREHTAQVQQQDREDREKRFRYTAKERDELLERAKTGEVNPRFLPVLFCSPTMELGVDIAVLTTVYLRNLPPTPANYAQRSGRAGRGGQAALVITYAAAQSPHDQYFFRDPKAMVHGQVRAPSLDLANRDLVDSHLHAVWLAASGAPLPPSIAPLLNLPAEDLPLKDEVRAPFTGPELATTAATRMAAVLDQLATELTPESAPWYPGAAAYAEKVAGDALDTFDRALRRWRELFRAAESQRDAARRLIDDHAAPAADRRAAHRLHDHAVEQLFLLQKGEDEGGSDFSTYRYLATEGFLPGYNFPRLPLLAFIPKPDSQGRATWLQRARFLGLAEFGPGSLIYHEGRAFRVDKALLRASKGSDARRLATEAVRICQGCGAGHFDEGSVCHACHRPLGDAALVREVFRIENVGTQPAERITANDEDRRRQGFELQTIFQWAVRDGHNDARRAEARDADGRLLTLTYGHGARITRLNLGLRRRQNKKELGFLIDPTTGHWRGATDEKNAPPTRREPQRIVPAVRDHKNALLVLGPADWTDAAAATFQYALVRGIEAVFELEPSELLAEPMPHRDRRLGCLLYEAAEGGAGVLSRLVGEPHKLAEVARTALEIMHYDVPAGPLTLPLASAPGAHCEAGCYRCLLSYYNQPDHELIDRQCDEVLELLVRLSSAVVTSLDPQPIDPQALSEAPAGGDWHAEAARLGLPAGEVGTGLVVYRTHFVVAILDAEVPGAATLADQGFEPVDFTDPATWPAAFATLASLLGVTP